MVLKPEQSIVGTLNKLQDINIMEEYNFSTVTHMVIV